MHLPDGFIDAKTALATGVLAAAGVGLALRQVRIELPPRRVPLLGLAAAFLFAAQLVNFPVIGGTSGHLVGGALVAALLGPAAAIVVVTTVLVVQCFLFADGGVTALGANIFNMGIVTTLSGYAVYLAVARVLPGLRGRVAALAFAGWCSTMLAAAACAGQLAWSAAVPWRVGFSAMAGVHAFIGLGEGAVSALILLAIARTRPDLLQDSPDRAAPPVGRFVGLGLLAGLGLALFVAPFACPWPDGLESVADHLGFARPAAAPFLPALAADYRWPGLASPGVALAVAGAAGVISVFVLAIAFSRLLVPKPTRPAGREPERPAPAPS
ncbi:MAG: energy-coupling factor ABC transporter permease [Verrucomicrobia bacterium]|nr:energy-coupling factor ABC transporter permease [Verrucomicrobiota bacterium]